MNHRNLAARNLLVSVLVIGALAAYGVLFALDFWLYRALPWPTVVMAWVLYTGAAGLVRFQARLLATRRSGSEQPGVTRRALGKLAVASAAAGGIFRIEALRHDSFELLLGRGFEQRVAVR